MTISGLGVCWLKSMEQVLNLGTRVDDYVEFLHWSGTFLYEKEDAIIENFANKNNITEMRKVFFSNETNYFGHSYKNLITGPRLRNDLSDIIELLTENNNSRKAVLTIGNTGQQSPCINAVQFLIRGGILRTLYFARSQDMFNKFYADAICIDDMSRTIAAALNIEIHSVTGIVSSAHIYLKDINEAKRIMGVLS